MINNFTKDNFINWVKTKKDEDKFNYYDPENCIFAQFLKSLGYTGKCGYKSFSLAKNESLSNLLPDWALLLQSKFGVIENTFGWVKKCL